MGQDDRCPEDRGGSISIFVELYEFRFWELVGEGNDGRAPWESVFLGRDP